jgi:NAD(P)-dependent dehydrogenase (short-subunit alcohol dehydrogenase family)
MTSDRLRSSHACSLLLHSQHNGQRDYHRVILTIQGISRPSFLNLAIGIGRESAIALSKAGWNVVLTARRADALLETASLCESSENCMVLAGDVTDETFVKTLFSETVARFG